MNTERLWKRHPRLFVFSLIVAGGIAFLCFGGLRLFEDASASNPQQPTTSAPAVSQPSGSSNDLGALENFASYVVPEGDHKLTIVLDCDTWSGKLILPWSHTFRVDGANIDVRNNSKKIFRIRSEETVDFGNDTANTVLQFRGTGTATVYVKRR